MPTAPTGVCGVRPSGFPVIVTRPARDADHWVQQLQQSGVGAEALPLIEIAPAPDLADAQALAQVWQTLASYAACLFVSGNAVDYFFKEKLLEADNSRAQAAINNVANDVWKLPPGLRFMAPGPGTVAALLAAGVPAAQIDAPAPDATQFDSEALWQVVGQRHWQGRRVLIVRGDSAATSPAAGGFGVAGATPRSPDSPGRDWISRQWQAAGAQLDFLRVYQRRPPRLTAAQMARAQAASADGSVWLFSSSEAVANLLALPALSGVDWRQARAVATHPRIVETARAAGWGVVVASRPALKDVNDTLRSIESGQP